MAVLNDREAVKLDAAPMGGTGFYYRERLINGEEGVNEAVKTYAKITVTAGSGMGYHQHVGDSEVYYILEGKGEYNDNGTWIPAKPGDVFLCRDGESHCIKNTGDTDMVFIALIVATA